MSLKRWNAKRDANEKALVNELRKRGYKVERVSGEGLPDILVRPKGKPTALAWGFEVKTEQGKRTEAQQETEWPIVRSLEDVMEVIGD